MISPSAKVSSSPSRITSYNVCYTKLLRTNRSRIQPRVAILKPLSAAIAIGTGGPFGAEGPIIQTGGALGSLIGQLIHTTASERKVLLACGAAAGMAATFSTLV